MTLRRLPALLLCLLAGCGGEKVPYELAPVSGKVTLDGQPLANATVVFQPTSIPGSATETGIDSVATTDEQGRYELRTQTDERGAVVGTHKVSITTIQHEEQDYSTEGLPPAKVVSKEKVPPAYNLDTRLTITVPAEGTDKADFDLKSR